MSKRKFEYPKKHAIPTGAKYKSRTPEDKKEIENQNTDKNWAY